MDRQVITPNLYFYHGPNSSTLLIFLRLLLVSIEVLISFDLHWTFWALNFGLTIALNEAREPEEREFYI